MMESRVARLWEEKTLNFLLCSKETMPTLHLRLKTDAGYNPNAHITIPSSVPAQELVLRRVFIKFTNNTYANSLLHFDAPWLRSTANNRNNNHLLSIAFVPPSVTSQNFYDSGILNYTFTAEKINHTFELRILEDDASGGVKLADTSLIEDIHFWLTYNIEA